MDVSTRVPSFVHTITVVALDYGGIIASIHERIPYFIPLYTIPHSLLSTHRLFFLFQAAQGYDPRKSKVSASTSEKWNSSAVTGDLTEVPGIGPAAVKNLAFDEQDRPHERVTNTYQLFGVYLTMKGPDDTEHGAVTSFEHNERFWQWLKAKGVVSHRSAIVKAVAEKCATFFADFYDANGGSLSSLC
jgi:hypothetical protein